MTSSATPGARAPGRIVQLVPAGPGGVRDYMDCLAAEWSRAGVACEAIAFTRELARQEPLHRRLAAFGPPGGALVLHFSGYGYAPRGLCGWLLDELAAVRAAHAGRWRIAVMFHELFAGGPPWRSAFWLSPLQADIARRLARLADVLWTNTEHHARWLHRATAAARPVHVRPVFSTIGEARQVPGLAERQAQLVVFGSPSTRRRAFDGLRGHERQLERLGVKQMVEVGNGGATGGERGCRHLGALPAADLARLLQESRFGLIDYPSIHLGKSSVFAAYAAHGCTVLNTARRGPAADGLAELQHYLTLGTAAGSCDLQQLAGSARRWYDDHALERQAAGFLATLHTGTEATGPG